MALVFAQNVCEMAIKATYAGRPHVNVLHFFNDEGAVSDAGKARDVLNAWQDHILSFLQSAYVLNSADWRSLDPDDQNSGTLTPDPAKNQAGTQAAPGAPPNVAYLIRKQSENRPRGRRDGRIFLGGVNENAVTDAGVIIPEFFDAINVDLGEFIDSVNDDVFGAGGGSGLCVLETTPASRAPGTQQVTVSSRPIIGLAVDQLVSTQRDRLR